MKKTIYIAILFLTIGMIATSCKKDCTSVDLSNTKWRGTLTVNSIIFDSTVVTFNENGKFSGTSAQSGGIGTPNPFDGTWSKTPNSNKVYMHHTVLSVPGTYEATATLNSDNTKLEGGVGVNSVSSTNNYTYTYTKI